MKKVDATCLQASWHDLRSIAGGLQYAFNDDTRRKLESIYLDLTETLIEAELLAEFWRSENPFSLRFAR